MLMPSLEIVFWKRSLYMYMYQKVFTYVSKRVKALHACEEHIFSKTQSTNLG